MSDDDYSSFADVRSLHEPRFKRFREIEAAEQLLQNLTLSPNKLIHEVFGKSTAPDVTAEFDGGRWIAIEVYEIFNPERRIAIEHNHRLQHPPQNSKPRKVPKSEVPVPNFQIWDCESFVAAVKKSLVAKDEKLLAARNSGMFQKIILCLYTDEATLRVELVEAWKDQVSYDGFNIDECYVQFEYVPGIEFYPFVRLF